MTVSRGRLRLAPRPATGVTLPVDAFFESLAAEAASRAIGIVLSGTGSDGSRGAEALDAAGAWVLAQDPESARFDGMPRAVMATGAAEQALSPEALAAEVATLIASGEARPARKAGEHGTGGELSLEAVLRLLAGVMRVDFGQYKPATVLRRIERRMVATGIGSLQGYADHLAAHPEEVDTLRRELLIAVTRFFRDAEAFDALRDKALVPLVKARAAGGAAEPLRAWIVATATGEEAYSIAMLLLQTIAEHAPGLALKIFATDVESTYLEHAMAGRYAEADLAEMPAALRERWFVRQDGGGWQVRPELRQRIVFSRHDVLADAPFTPLDLVACRNMLIYLRPSAQDRVIRRLSYALRPGGILFLGTSETPTVAAGDYEVVDSRQKIYRLQRRTPTLPPEDLMAGRAVGLRGGAARGSSPEGQATRKPAQRALEAMAQRYAPPSILVTPTRELVHLFGDVRRLLRFRPGDASLDVLQLLPPTLMPVVATLLHSALRERTPQRSRPIPVRFDDGETEGVLYQVAVWPLDGGAGQVDQLLVCFESPAAAVPPGPPPLADATLTAMSSEQVADLERELEATRANLQDTIQELGAANEELQATNEELMASNEELQSTNEELQSVNEELHTVNAELQGKIEELNGANADLESLSRASRIPLIFLDAQMRLTRFTVEAMALFRFRTGDLGRPITDFSHTLDYPELFDDIRASLDAPAPRQREVRDELGRRWLVTMQPYASADRERTRIVITCVDVSSLRDVQRLQAVLDALPEHVAVLDHLGVIQIVNRSWREFAARNGDPGLHHCGPGVSYLEACRAGAPQDEDARSAVQGLSAVLDGSRPAFMMAYPCHSPDEERWFLMHVAPLAGGGCVVTHFNVTGWVDPARLRGTFASR